jgi:hypothetical protein
MHGLTKEQQLYMQVLKESLLVYNSLH